MYSPLQSAINYLKFYFNASNGKGHGMHSPFVFEFITKVLNDHSIYPEYEKVEKLRSQLRADNTLIKVKDLGAGGHRDPTRSIASIAKRSLKPAKYAQLLFRIARYYQPQQIIELGTSLGITTSYLALANPQARLYTFEGAGSIVAKALENFKRLGLSNIQLVEGNFDDTLDAVLDPMKKIDLAFIDGNHYREPTERYFYRILPKTHNDSIFIVDDIHWSREMEAAWETIISNDPVTCSIDLFHVGLVFFRREFKGKQNFKIRY